MGSTLRKGGHYILSLPHTRIESFQYLYTEISLHMQTQYEERKLKGKPRQSDTIRNMFAGNSIPVSPEYRESVAIALINYFYEASDYDAKWAFDFAKRLLKEEDWNCYPNNEAILSEVFGSAIASNAYQNLDVESNNLPDLKEPPIDRPVLIKDIRVALKANPVVSLTGGRGIGKKNIMNTVAHHCLHGEKGFERFQAVVWIEAEKKYHQPELLPDVLQEIGRIIRQADQDWAYNLMEDISSLEEKQQKISDKLKSLGNDGKYILICISNYDNFSEKDKRLTTWLLDHIAPHKALITSSKPIDQLRRIEVQPLDQEMADDLLLHLDQLKNPGISKKLREVFQQSAVRQQFCKTTNGNLQVMKIALGLIEHGIYGSPEDFCRAIERFKQQDNFDSYEMMFFTWLWKNHIPRDAEKLLIAYTLFTDIIQREALQITLGYEDDDYQGAYHLLRSYSLISSQNGYLSIHNSIQEYVQVHIAALKKEAGEEWDEYQKMHQRKTAYYKALVREAGVKDSNAPKIYEKLATEWENVQQEIRQAIEGAGKDAACVDDMLYFIEHVERFTHIYGHWEYRVEICKDALAVLEDERLLIEDRERKIAWMQNNLLWTLAQQNNPKNSGEQYVEPVRRYLSITDNIQIKDRFYNSLVTYWQHQYLQDLYNEDDRKANESLDEFNQAVRDWEDDITEDLLGEKQYRRSSIEVLYERALVSYALYEKYERLTDRDAAKKYLAEMLRLSRQKPQWERAIAYALNYMAKINIMLGQLDEAEKQLEESEALISQRWHDRRRLAFIQRTYARLFHKKQQREEALKRARLAHSWFDDLGMQMEVDKTVALIKEIEEA